MQLIHTYIPVHYLCINAYIEENHLATSVLIDDKFRRKTFVLTKESERNMLVLKQKYCIIEKSQNTLKR